jgi:biotin carboxyl carrier protein
MHAEYLHGDHVHAVELTDLNDGTFIARITVRPTGAGRRDEPLSVREVRLNVRPTAPGLYSVLVGHDVHDALVATEGDRRSVTLPSGTVALELVDRYRAAGVVGPARKCGPQAVTSPMPGRVVKLLVAVGDSVEEGQTVVVVEAMKMANELRAPIRGVVQAVHVETGAPVEGGRPLVVVAPVDVAPVDAAPNDVAPVEE